MRLEYVRGDRIERSTGKGTARSPLTYRWTQGYHLVLNGKKTYPAVTRREAMIEARQAGGVARFTEDNPCRS